MFVVKEDWKVFQEDSTRKLILCDSFDIDYNFGTSPFLNMFKVSKPVKDMTTKTFIRTDRNEFTENMYVRFDDVKVTFPFSWQVDRRFWCCRKVFGDFSKQLCLFLLNKKDFSDSSDYHSSFNERKLFVIKCDELMRFLEDVMSDEDVVKRFLRELPECIQDRNRFYTLGKIFWKSEITKRKQSINIRPQKRLKK